MREKRVEFKVEGQKLIGTLCFPEGKGSFPGVVFYHGMVSDRKGYILLCQKLAEREVMDNFWKEVGEILKWMAGPGKLVRRGKQY